LDFCNPSFVFQIQKRRFDYQIFIFTLCSINHNQLYFKIYLNMEQENLSTSQGQENLPNGIATLVLGILSLVFCFIYGIPGLILGIIGLVLGNKDRALYNSNPSRYLKGSYNNSNADRVCSLIGLCLSALFIVFIAIVILFFGALSNIL
jgi:hypothetical protein